MTAAGLFVVDCPVGIGWLFDEQTDDYSEAALQALAASFAVAPRWWNIEFSMCCWHSNGANVWLPARPLKPCACCSACPFSCVKRELRFFELHALAERHRLTSYDALYLNIALAIGLPLATRDKALRQAAIDSGVGIWRS